MGSWGTGLYSDDTACDVRDTFREVVKLPLDGPALGQRMAARFGMGDDPMAEEEVDLWLALADQMHLYALEAPEVMATARRIIETGADLAAKRELGMDDGDLAKRERALKDLLEKWSAPHPKPRRRKTIKGPEPFAFERGDCYAYPTMRGWALPYGHWDFDAKTADETFRPDGWGAFVVLDRWMYEDYYARYLIAVTYLEATNRPTLDEFRAAPVDGAIIPGQDLHLETIASCYMKNPKRELKLLRAESIGRLEVDLTKLREDALVLRRQIHGAPQGDNQLGNILSLRKRDGMLDDTRHLPCPHMIIGDYCI